ncbi:hypothetical protein F443_09180 [Phytophthora nicotianae P1569]|nr:hypothetical protein F443_09180 [Phytophthora nicotianae P1569]
MDRTQSVNGAKVQATRGPKAIGRPREPVGPSVPRRRSTTRRLIGDQGVDRQEEDQRSRSRPPIKKLIGDRLEDRRNQHEDGS